MNKPAWKRLLINRGAIFMLVLVFYNLILSAAINEIYFLFPNFDVIHFILTPWFIIASQVVAFLLPLALWLFFTKDRLSRNLANKPLGNVNILLIFCVCFFLQPALMTLSALSALFFPNPVAEALSFMQDYPFPVLVAAFAVTPAFCEEIVFRGYIQNQYRHVDIKIAVWINGLFFAIIHMSAQQFPYALLMGAFFACCVYYTRSVRAGVLAHFFINFFQVSLSRFLLLETAEMELAETAAMADMWQAILSLAVVAVIFLPGAVILFYVFLRHNRQRNMKYDIHEAIHGVNGS